MPPETDAERRPDGTFPRSGRGYRWAPFQENNEAAVKHGATSPRAVLPIADGIAKELLESAPWACRVTYGATVRAWAWAEAQAVLLRTYLHEHGILDGEGVPRPAVGLLERVETRAANLRNELGLSPLALARLLGAFSSAPAGADDDGLSALKAEGRKTSSLAICSAHGRERH